MCHYSCWRNPKAKYDDLMNDKKINVTRKLKNKITFYYILLLLLKKYFEKSWKRFQVQNQYWKFALKSIEKFSVTNQYNRTNQKSLCSKWWKSYRISCRELTQSDSWSSPWVLLILEPSSSVQSWIRVKALSASIKVRKESSLKWHRWGHTLFSTEVLRFWDRLPDKKKNKTKKKLFRRVILSHFR